MLATTAADAALGFAVMAASVQLVAPPGGADLLFAMAAELAALLPLRRHPQPAEQLLSRPALRP